MQMKLTSFIEAPLLQDNLSPMLWALKSFSIRTRGSGAKEQRLYPWLYAFAPIQGLQNNAFAPYQALQNISPSGPETSLYLDLDEVRGSPLNTLRPTSRNVDIHSRANN
jgi:hypothetical protein